MTKNTGKTSGKTVNKASTGKKISKKAAAAKKKKRRVLFAIEAIVLLVLIVAVYVMGKFDKLDKSVDVNEENLTVNEGIENIEGVSEGYTNIALFGLDSRENGAFGKGNRSDTMIIASINNKTGDVKLASVYRDTYLNLSDDSYRKANEAYFYGGPEQAIKMLNMNLDLNITKYVAVDFNAVVTVVDLLGGIEIDVQEDEIDHLNNYTVETSAVTGVTTTKLTKTGLQTLDGVQAVSYARIRYTDGGDYKRTERQRLIIEKIAEKAKKVDLVTLNNIVDKVLPNISTNLTTTELAGFAASAAKYNLADQTGFPFDKTTKNWKKSIGDVVVPITLETNVSQLHTFLFGDESYAPSSTVQAISKRVVEDTGISK
ncbi:LCP family protein [Konateibacter massiliensis]|uniref:LCP family protein n=1 Tax=Konateibacter massiliensis TaxID=2002841 RepID=UPI000C15B1AD|nr:LCP family protein [Konateibacter massiliensis]